MKKIIPLFMLLWAVSLRAQTEDSGSQVFTVVEEMPQFQGGEKGLLEYLGTIPYPKEAIVNDIEGSVYVRFVIEKDGSVGDVEVAKSSQSELLDETAVAHVKKMPLWLPGKQNGKLVRTQFIVPINFKLVGDPPPADKKKKRD